MHEHEFQGQKLRHEHRGDSQAHGYYDHAEDGSHRRSDVKRINTREELKALASELGVRPDWHEPDERGVNALVSGHMLDNAGFWGQGGTGSIPSAYQELWVTITVEEEGVAPRPVAEVNLAMLLAWSCGYEEPPRRATRITVTDEVAERATRY